ncbi:pre-rRNA-processing protein TSR2 homolog [Procambarus clarkii]|uniref:pre-rRNA-processing protein TSR2 homolog n=1 Tax=Procambarus clarkii TaxID=6728 RepID=UPI001E675CF3|nr:pre-rRNA-processing protein TSR2 homolog [Procambarus clarkii]XP_045591839.1 pre-rRNA-processing protein TSR2 homolog [Procambarus clarkii]
MVPTFKKAVGVALGSWNPLQFAVQQEAGGKESAAIAEWMVGIIEQYFYDNEDLEPEEVADYLATIMDQELNTLVDDESDVEIGKCLCHLYQLCVAGNDAQVMDELSKMPKCDLSLCRIQEQPDVENEDNAPLLVAAHMSGLQLNEGDKLSANTCNGQTPKELTDLERQHLEDEKDGWTVIRKGNKRQ